MASSNSISQEQLEAELRTLRTELREQSKILRDAAKDLKHHESRHSALVTSINILQDQVQVAKDGIQDAEEMGYQAAVRYEAALEKSKETKRLMAKASSVVENGNEHGNLLGREDRAQKRIGLDESFLGGDAEMRCLVRSDFRLRASPDSVLGDASQSSTADTDRPNGKSTRNATESRLNDGPLRPDGSKSAGPEMPPCASGSLSGRAENIATSQKLRARAVIADVDGERLMFTVKEVGSLLRKLRKQDLNFEEETAASDEVAEMG